MDVLVIGAAGGVGRRLATLLTSRGDHVTGLHRKPDQAAIITATGATPAPGDLIADSVDELAARMRGHDAVVFSAGAHGTGLDQTTLIDGKGLEKAAAAAAQAGVSTFVLVSAFPESERGRFLSEGYEHYMRVKKAADVYLTRTQLEWLIIRPGSLGDEPGTGHVSAAVATDYAPIARDDVAGFIAGALHEPALRRIIIELTGGPIPIADAVTFLATGHTPHRN
jgi:uncharacterized protein YbjT (DUF2867 family)